MFSVFENLLLIPWDNGAPFGNNFPDSNDNQVLNSFRNLGLHLRLFGRAMIEVCVHYYTVPCF